MPFTTVISTKATLSDVLVQKFSEGIPLAYKEAANPMDWVTQKLMGMASTYTFRKFTSLTPTVTALTEDEDVTSTSLPNSKVVATPAQYGDVITRSAIANFASGGTVDMMAQQVIATSMAESQALLALTRLAASSNIIYPNDSYSAKTQITGTDILNATLLEKGYNKIRRQKIPFAFGNRYGMIAHPDVISDLRNAVSAGDWLDVNKYSNPANVMSNQVAEFKGFTVFEHALTPITADGGSGGTVDVYPVILFGYNALGYAESEPLTTVISQTDKLERFLHIGWKGTYDFQIVDTNAVQVIWVASGFQA